MNRGHSFDIPCSSVLLFNKKVPPEQDFKKRKIFLPDADAFLRSYIQLLARLRLEGLVPDIHVYHGAVGTVLTGRVWIGEDQLGLGFRYGVVGPDLRPAQ